MSRLARLLESAKGKNSLNNKGLNMKCSKCNKKPATDSDGFCDFCRYNALLTRIIETRQ
jgi:hypothetical protein